MYFQHNGPAEEELYSAVGSFNAWSDTNTWALVGDTAAPGGLLAWRPGHPFMMDTSVAQAYVASNPTTDLWTAEATRADINLWGSGPDGDFPTGNLTYPIPTPATENFAVNATASITPTIDNYVGRSVGTFHISAVDDYTFGVNSAQDFILTLTGPGGPFAPILRTAGDSLATFHLGIGDYTATLMYWNNAGGSGIEVYSVQGSFSAWGDTSAWTLIGDTAHSGLPVTGGWATTFYYANIPVVTQADAQSVVDNPSNRRSSNQTESAPYINYDWDGTGGHFFSGPSRPLNLTVADRVVLGSIDYTFGVNSKDGFRLTVGGATITQATNAVFAGNQMWYDAGATPSIRSGWPISRHRGLSPSACCGSTAPAGPRPSCTARPGSSPTSATRRRGPWSATRATAGCPSAAAVGLPPSTSQISRLRQSILAATTLINTPTQQEWTATETAPYVNYMVSGTDGHFFLGGVGQPANENVANRSLPVPANLALRDIAVHVKSVIYIPADGDYTFCVNSTEGFALSLTPVGGGNTYSMSSPGLQTAVRTLKSFDAADGTPLTAGQYNLDLVHFIHQGGAEIELSAASGVYGAFDSSAFTLVGAPGSPFASWLSGHPIVLDASVAQGIIADPTQAAWTETGVVPRVNLLASGSGGNFGNNLQFPGITQQTDNFVARRQVRHVHQRGRLQR